MGVTIRSTNNVPRFKRILRELGKTEIKVGVFGDEAAHGSEADIVTIARANEFGVTIKPKTKKWLALPTRLARHKRPKDFTDLKFVMTHNHKKALLVRETAGGRGGRGARTEIFFILVKAVTIPERSFLRSGFDKNVNKIMDKMERHIGDVFKFRINPHVFADMIGQEFAGLIQLELRDLSSPQNAPLTIANKRSENPLIDGGRLVGAIRHEVL